MELGFSQPAWPIVTQPFRAMTYFTPKELIMVINYDGLNKVDLGHSD